ncbi:MAG: chloride channel protein [Paucibacter sp.]|nr:chloride channel protein [Roseateles sp.]
MSARGLERAEFDQGAHLAPILAVLKPQSSGIAISSGGPFGADGPIIMTSRAIGSLLAHCFCLSAAERQALLVAGAAAGLSAYLRMPLATVLLPVGIACAQACKGQTCAQACEGQTLHVALPHESSRAATTCMPQLRRERLAVVDDEPSMPFASLIARSDLVRPTLAHCHEEELRERPRGPGGWN